MEILNQLLGMTADQRPQFLASLTPDQLVELRASLVESVQSHPDTTDEEVAALQSLVATFNLVKGEIGNRQSRSELATSLRSQVVEPETPAETTEVSTPAIVEPVEPVVQPAADPEPATPTPEPVLVTASVTLPPPGQAPSSTPTRTTPDLAKPFVAAADFEKFPTGTRLGYRELAEAFMERQSQFRGQAPLGRQNVPLARAYANFPEDRRIDPTNTAANGQLLARVSQERIQQATLVASGMDPNALTAAGGYCADLAPAYNYLNITTNARPVRDSLPQAQGVARGGFSFTNPIDFTAYEDAVDQWTEADDIAALTDSNVRKPCMRIECGAHTEVIMYAVTKCFTIGNLQAYAWPELIADALEKGVAAQARFAERLLLTAIDANSTDHTDTSITLGAMRDVLYKVMLEVAAFRDRNRTDPNMRLRMIAPMWLRNALVSDLWRQMPGDGTLRAAEGEMNAYLNNAGVDVTWAIDGVPTGGGFPQIFPALAGGVQPSPYPTRVRLRIFHEGAHVFMAGPTLDMGVVRDSTLNVANDFQIFAENFEGLATPGFDPIYLDLAICPTGEAAALVDVPACGSGGS